MSSINLREKIAKAPDAPGVYLMKDSSGNILYVGKAKSLKKRLMSYFRSGLSDKTLVLMSLVETIEYRLTPTEGLALLLENSLIKQHLPKYNVSLRDDKGYPMVKITNEEFPAICITRKVEPDRARYFGPYTSAGLLQEALKVIRRNFPYRSCRQMPGEACMYYRIGLSPAPCIGKISKKDYAATIDKIAMVLEGRTEELVARLSKEMFTRAKAKDYEAAAKIRDQIDALSSLSASRPGLSRSDELLDLKGLLGLDKLPERIEAFDISNIFGKEATGSMVSFYKGVPDKDNYRRFRIKTVAGIDDYSMLAEVVRRRYMRLKDEGLKFPDLILIDGGRGHLFTAKKAMESLGVEVPLASIAKEKEHIYIPARSAPIKLKEATPALNLIRRIRDEAHRFAVSYHHVLRRKKIIGK